MAASSVVFYDLNLSELRPPLNQIRELDNLNDLMRSILEKGLLQPIIVRMINDEIIMKLLLAIDAILLVKD
jgi:ParB-like chromosome segregation protein Spo0J